MAVAVAVATADLGSPATAFSGGYHRVGVPAARRAQVTLAGGSAALRVGEEAKTHGR
ncbi:MAG TPA: hypothetical protein VF518_05680 [Polyangia bacterium]